MPQHDPQVLPQILAPAVGPEIEAHVVIRNRPCGYAIGQDQFDHTEQDQPPADGRDAR